MIKLLIFISLLNCFDCIPVTSSLDWRTKGAVLPVPNLGPCAQAGVLDALDCISAAHQIKSGQLIRLSAQQIYDCGGDLCPCAGSGSVSHVYDLIFREGLNYQIDSDESYPYTGKCNKKCNFKKSGAVTTLSGYTFATNTSHEIDLYRLISRGPVTVGVEANMSFQIYTNGILDDPNCKGDELNHVLLLVGYGTENGVDYWIARNSWGTNWGENGYIRIVRNKNMCGIGKAFVQPFINN